jgi:hypothetical protein
MHESRGGYGYLTPVPATVVRVGPKRITIDAQLARGGTKRITVSAESLRDIRTEAKDSPGSFACAYRAPTPTKSKEDQHHG